MNISPNLDANHTILYSIYAVDSSNEVLQLVIVEQNDGVNGDDQTSISQTFLLSFKIQSLYELELKGILKLDGGQSTTDNDFPSLLKSLRFANGKERREFAAVLREKIKSPLLKDGPQFKCENYQILNREMLIPTKRSASLDPSAFSDHELVLNESETSNPYISANKELITENVKDYKNAWLANQLKSMEIGFVEYDQKQIFVGTWNVAGNPCSQDLSLWLKSEEGTSPDIYVLGFQEIDTSTEAYVVYDSAKEQEWSLAIDKALGGPSVYAKVASKQLVGLLIMVYANASISSLISDVKTTSLATGMLGMVGNKGACAVRFRLADSYISVVDCHFAADVDQYERRNEEFKTVLSRLKVDCGATTAGDYYRENSCVPIYTLTNDGISRRVKNLSPSTVANKAKTLPIYDCDHLIFLGDFNYRLTISAQQAKSMLQQPDSTLEVFKFDQLSKEKRAGRVFAGFNEMEPTFKPTYKFDIGTDTYDTSEKMRCPAWCDRILWRIDDSTTQPQITGTKYQSHSALVSSDHKPVSALLNAPVRFISKERWSGLRSSLLRKLDVFENEARPSIQIKPTDVKFGCVYAGISTRRKVDITNSGRVCVRIGFRSATPWMKAVPSTAYLFPGETATIWIEINVSFDLVERLNRKRMKLDDVLVFGVENGTDYFLPISATWVTSSFGEYISLLNYCVKPVTSYDPSDFVDLARKVASDGENSPKDPTSVFSTAGGLSGVQEGYSIPKEVSRLVEFISKHGMKIDDLFQRTGDPLICQYIFNCLDTGKPFDESKLFSNILNSASVLEEYELLSETSPKNLDDPELSYISKGKNVAIHSAFNALQILLGSFVEPVIPIRIQDRCINEGYLSVAAAKQVLTQVMPWQHHSIFLYIISFLKQTLGEYKGEPKMDAVWLSKTFAPLLFKTKKEDPAAYIASISFFDSYLGYSDSTRRAMFLQRFIE